jgi:uncharacterized protein (DUF433 family)
MNRVHWRDHVVVSNDLCHGGPCIPVQTLTGSLAAGMKPEEILKEYLQPSLEDLLGALAGAYSCGAAGAAHPEDLAP